MGEPRLTELPARYNAAETFIDSHRGVRETSIAIRCQGQSVTYGELAANVYRRDPLSALGSARSPPADTTPDDECFWLYSSGTTGFPKGAVHLQHDMVYCTDTYGAEVLRTTEADRHFTVSPLFHAYGLGNGV